MAWSDGAPRMVRVLSALVLVATFGAGVGTGIGVSSWPRKPGPPPLPGPMPLEQLGLSAEQRDKAGAIMERHRPELDAILREGFPRVREINERLENEIRQVLTVEQQARFDELKAQRPPLSRQYGRPPFGPRRDEASGPPDALPCPPCASSPSASAMGSSLALPAVASSSVPSLAPH
jgi:Spy/CpxP family protein refolding chaperone